MAELDRNLWICASDGDLQGVQEFLGQGVDVNAYDENGYTAIHAATSYGHVDLIHFLVSRGANVNIQDHDGESPLFVCEEKAVAEVLVGHGADISLTNDEGKKAMEVAEGDGHIAVANYLRDLAGLPPAEEKTDDEEEDDEEEDADGDAME